MRVLFVSRYTPWPLHNGGAVRTFAMITGLSKLHRVTLMVPEPDNEAIRLGLVAAYEGLVERVIWVPIPVDQFGMRFERRNVAMRALKSLLDLFTHWTPLAFRQAASPWRTALEQQTTEFDIAICRYAWLSPAFFGLGLRRVIFDLDDVQFLFLWRELANTTGRLRQIRSVAEVLRTWLAEQVLSLRSARVLICSREDAGYVIGRRKTVVPNGMTIETGPTAPRRPDTVVFVGYCGWTPNRHGLQWFVENVWPLVIASRPHARLQLVGRGANLETLPFANHSTIDMIPDVPSVKPWYESATVSIAPILFAGGTRIKIIESLGYGTPVVATQIGAGGLTEVFDQSHGLYVVDGSKESARQLCNILAAPAAALAGAERGSKLVDANYTWEGIVRPLAENLEGWVRPAQASQS